MTDIPILPQDCDARIRQLYDYWQAICPAADVLPGRQHLDPVHIPKLLPWLWLVDVHQGESLRFKFRLVGTEQVVLRGRDPTGPRPSVGRPRASSMRRTSIIIAAHRRSGPRALSSPNGWACHWPGTASRSTCCWRFPSIRRRCGRNSNRFCDEGVPGYER
jgi:hypothetical protein